MMNNSQYEIQDPDPEDINEQCDNAVFEVCATRERYPERCAEELGKYLTIKTNMAMAPVVLKPSPETFEIPAFSDIQEHGTSEKDSNTHHNFENNAEKLQSMINKVQELKVVLKQLEDNKNLENKS